MPKHRRSCYSDHVMTISACPADDVAAPVEVVWSLLDDPMRFDLWWDARTKTAEPPGRLAPGQHVEARAKGVFPARVRIDVIEVDVAARRIQMIAHLPFGVVDHFTVTVAEIGRAHV